MRMLLQFTKLDAMGYISHLDFQRLWQKLFRIAGIELQKTEGYNPHPKMRFAVPLATGFQSENELLEIYLVKAMEPKELISALNSVSPQGLRVLAATPLPEGFPKITSVVDALEYRVDFALSPPLANGDDIDVVQTKSGDIKVSEFLLNFRQEDNNLRLLLKVDMQKTLRPDIIVSHLYPDIGVEKISITRIGIYSHENDRIDPVPAGLQILA